MALSNVKAPIYDPGKYIRYMYTVQWINSILIKAVSVLIVLFWFFITLQLRVLPSNITRFVTPPKHV